MLKGMRKHAKYFYVLFFIVILSFIFWGIGPKDISNGVEIVAEVGRYKITADEYWKVYDGVYRFYRELYKEKFDDEMEKNLKLKEKVLDQMVNERVLLIAAQEEEIQTSDEELQDAITRDPAFMKNGVFDKGVYLNRLKMNRMTPELFENLKRQELTLTKMRRMIELAVDVTDMESAALPASGNEQLATMLSQTMLNDKKEKAIQAYVEGLKKQIKIKVNKQVIT
jgi:peptidyl-prolyl cis-trans isomerase D